MSLASEQIENQLKANPNEEDFNKGIPFSIAGAMLTAQGVRAHTHTYILTHIFPIKLQVEWDFVLFKKICKWSKHWYGMPVYLPLFWLKSQKYIQQENINCMCINIYVYIYYIHMHTNTFVFWSIDSYINTPIIAKV